MSSATSRGSGTRLLRQSSGSVACHPPLGFGVPFTCSRRRNEGWKYCEERGCSRCSRTRNRRTREPTNPRTDEPENRTNEPGTGNPGTREPRLDIELLGLVRAFHDEPEPGRG